MKSPTSLLIQNLHVQTADGKQILNGVSLTITTGEVHALMGPNGSGKSTLAAVLLGHPGYVVTAGKIWVGGVDVTAMSPDQRAKQGLFLGFQYPVEVAGVNFANFLRLSINEKAKKHGEKKVSPIVFRQQVAQYAQTLAFNSDIAKRSLNEGFSGGEKKKAEILQLALLKPKFAILDEPDSGLDVDALRYIGQTIHTLTHPFGLLLITHYQRILEYIKPDFVHVLVNGKIVQEGNASLAKSIEQAGYEQFI